MSNTSIVRLALAGDVEPILALLALWHAEEGSAPADVAKIRGTLARLIARDGGVVGIVRGADGVGAIEATIGLDLSAMWYSSAPHLAKLWMFVHPDHRKSSHAKAMLEFSKMYADQIGIPLWADERRAPESEAKMALVCRQLPEHGRVFLYNARSRNDAANVAA